MAALGCREKWMRFLIRTLQVIVALALVVAAALWFGARRGDRGFIEEEITVARPAAAVFRWISSEDLARRWVSDLIELRKTEANGAPDATTLKLVELVNGHRVAMSVRVVRVVPNRELSLLIFSEEAAAGGFSGDANFNLIPGDDYTRLVFSSHTQFVSLGDRICEPILTLAMQRKMHADLERLKILIEAEPERPASPHGPSLSR
jgi:uncharacterized protein YndB with AHSA1/START domain